MVKDLCSSLARTQSLRISFTKFIHSSEHALRIEWGSVRIACILLGKVVAIIVSMVWISIISTADHVVHDGVTINTHVLLLKIIFKSEQPEFEPGGMSGSSREAHRESPCDPEADSSLVDT